MSDETIVWRQVVCLRETPGETKWEGYYLQGYAVVFNQRSQQPVTDYGDPAFEMIAPGAFTDSIAKNNIKLQPQHLDLAEIASTGSKTLEIGEDEKGHPFKAQVPEFAETLRSKVSSGAMKTMSFGFVPQEIEKQPDGTVLVKKGDLRHISPVYTNTAQYLSTSVSLNNGQLRKRSLMAKYVDFLKNNPIEPTYK